LLVIWLGIIPLLIGLFFDLAFLQPLRVSVIESANFFIYHDWALGLFYLKVWVRITMLDGYPNNWKPKFEKVLRDGIVGVQFMDTVKGIIVPITMPLLVLLTAPYILVKGIIPLFTSSFLVQSWYFRFVYLGMVAGYLLSRVVLFLADWFPKFRQSVFDDKYLVGRRLHNFKVTSVGAVAS